jgi:nucleotide-binding universal stress UspA family protein
MTAAIHITRILVPVDGSECSRYAAEHGVLIAQAYASAVVFLHVVDDQIAGQLAQLEPVDGEARARERLVEQGRIYLRDVARLAVERGVKCEEIVAEGDPCAAICDRAARHQVDLIVMGKIGRRGARRILVGSITRRVIESTALPVLIVAGPPGAACAGDRDSSGGAAAAS